jgi:hypothetical protein
METLEQTAISLGLGHEDQECKDFAAPLFLQLSRGRYDLCSVMQMPESTNDWRREHRTARKRADRAARLGYFAERVSREKFCDDLHAINTSLDERQGREMTAAYRQPVSLGPLPAYRCGRHAIHTYGVLLGSRLVAYLWLYRAGDLALVSSILGHGDHLANDVMYLLFEAMLDDQAASGGQIVYNRHDSGTGGLRYFKERLGFTEQKVAWLP